MAARLRSLVWPALVAAGALLPLLPGLVPGRTLAWRDSALLHGPVRGLVVEALREGRLPLWNPYAGAGEPILAQAMHAVLHPVSLATALVSPSIDLLLAALVVTAALGAWVAARLLAVRPAAAAVAGFAYGLSGYVLGMTGNAGYLAGAATLPWTVAGLRAAATVPGGWIAATAGVAAAGLSGDPGTLAAGVVIGLALATKAAGARGALRGAAATALGVAGAAVQLLPTWEWTGETIRASAALVPAAGGQWSLDLARLPELVSPGLFVGLPRSYRAPVFEAFGGTADSPFPWAPSVFVGAPILLLALSPGRALRRTAAVLLGLAALFLWIALGQQAGASQLLGALPVWGALRYWEKMVAPLGLLVALAAAVGADAIGEEGAPRLPRRAVGVALVLLLAAGIALLVPVAPGGAAWLYRSRLAAGLGFSAASMLALAAVTGSRLALPGSAAGRVALLVLVQSAAAAPFALHWGSSAATEPRPPTLPAAPPGARVVTPFPTNFATGAGDLDAIDRTLALQGRTGWPAANVASRIENAESYTGFGSIRAATVAGAGALKWPLLRRLGATHVVSPEPSGARDADALRRALGNAPREVARGADGVWAWEVEHRERATFAPGVRAVPGLREAAQAMGPVLAGRSPDVIVEAPFAPPAGPGRVLSVSRTDASLKVEGECAAPCLLVVNEAWAPGWVAEIDGRPAPVLPADVLVRAVPWPAGRHAMAMRYEAPGLPLGLAMSGTSAVVVAAGALLERRRRARRRGA